MNIIVPMAGAGSRFEKAGYTFPKPLIEVKGQPMIAKVVENLNLQGRYIFLVQKTHYDKYDLKNLLNLIAPGCEIVQIEGLTEGAACTVLKARDLIDNDTPLIISNSDQFIKWNSFETEVAEKNPISSDATVGIYHWKKGSNFVKYADQMIEKNIRTNNEFYVCPVYNEAFKDGLKVKASLVDEMWGMGTPEELNNFLTHYKS
jgi:NDP-sugar pyrophosphorylase family protein